MWQSTGVSEAEDGATEDGNWIDGRGRVTGVECGEKRLGAGTVAGMGTPWGDSALKEELAG